MTALDERRANFLSSSLIIAIHHCDESRFESNTETLGTKLPFNARFERKNVIR